MLLYEPVLPEVPCTQYKEEYRCSEYQGAAVNRNMIRAATRSIFAIRLKDSRMESEIKGLRPEWVY